MEPDKFSLQATYQAWWLFADEVALNASGVVATASGFEGYLRVDLRYNRGWFVVVATFQDGRVPPAHRKVKATALGLAVKL